MCAATSSNTRMSSPSLVSGLHSHEAVMVEGQGEGERERERERKEKKGEYEKKGTMFGAEVSHLGRRYLERA